MATIRDVAREAKVSIATISKVLNHKGSISEETRRRVMDAIQNTGYQKNFSARAMKTNRSYTVGLVIPSISNPFYPLLARSAENVLLNEGYTMFLCNTDRQEQLEYGYLKSLVERQVDGIIFFSPSPKVCDWIEELPIQNTVCVAIEAPLDESLDYLKIDYSGIREAVKYIVSLKHRRIAYLTGPLSRPCNRKRLEMFRNSLTELNVPIVDEFIAESNFEYEGGYNLAWHLLKHPTPPTAIFTGNDLMAFGVLNCITEQGLRVPEDISVIGFDDIPQAGYFIPSLTTVRQPATELGKISAKYIVDKLAGREFQGSLKVQTSLVIRRSTTFCNPERAGE